MTIRQQVFAFVVPLFALCGAVGAFVSAKLQKEAIDDAFRAQADSLLIALAEFIPADDVAALAAGRELKDTHFGAALDRLDRWQLARRIVLFEAASGRILVDSGATESVLPSWELMKTVAPGEVRLLPLVVGAAVDQAHIPAATPVADGAAVLEVDLPAAEYVAAFASIREDAAVDFVIATLIGFITAAVLAGFVARQIGGIGTMVRTLGTESFPRDATESAIAEAADLGNSLNVMHNVLAETIERTRNLLPESDRYRSERGLAADLQREFQGEGKRRAAGIEATWFTVGTPPPAALAGLVPRGEDSGMAFVGVAGAATQFTPVLRSGAAAAYLADALKTRPVAETLAEVRTLFGLKQLEALEWTATTRRRWRLGANGIEALAADEWRPGDLVSLHCLGPVNDGRAGLYVAQFAGGELARVRTELPALFDATEPGVAMLLRQSHAAPTLAPA